jgi:hypothetical protein
VDKARVVIYGAIDPWRFPLSGHIVDESGKPLSDVQVSVGLVSLGQVGTTTSDARGKYYMDFPAGEYIVIPSKAGYTFTPESILLELPRRPCSVNFRAAAAP